MSFLLPTTTTATTTQFSFGSLTANANAPKPQFGNLGGGDASSIASTTMATTTTTASTFFSNPNPTVASIAPAAKPNFSFGLSTPAPTSTVAPAAVAPTVTTTNTANPLLNSLTKTTAPVLNLTATQPVAQVAPTTTATSGLGGTGFANLSTATKTTDSTKVTTSSQLSYNQLEEFINKWTLELEDQEKAFTDQATQINAWDKVLMNNNQKILDLNEAVQKVKADQQNLDQELEFISTQQKELEESLLPLQKEFQAIPAADVERSVTYMLVENIDTQLKQMSEDLKEIIDNLNEANKGQDNTDPIIQIGKILNAHMSSLQWIETNSTNMSNKLEDLNKIHENFKRESERSFRSAYYN